MINQDKQYSEGSIILSNLLDGFQNLPFNMENILSELDVVGFVI